MTDAEFATAVLTYLGEQDDGWNARRDALARQFECGPSTVIRWASGTTQPHPILRLLITRWIGARS